MDCGRAVLPCRLDRSAPAFTTLWTATADGVRTTDEPSAAPYAPWARTRCGARALSPAPVVRRRARGVRLLSLAGLGRVGRPGTGQRLGPDQIWIPRVGRRVLRPHALAPDPRPVDADALHYPASRHAGRVATGGPGCLRRLCCAGAGGAANSSSATARAQRIRSAAASGWSPNSWATRWTHPKPP